MTLSLLAALLAVLAVAIAVPALIAGRPGEAAFALTQWSDAGAFTVASHSFPGDVAACQPCLTQSVSALDAQAAQPLPLRMPRPIRRSSAGCRPLRSELRAPRLWFQRTAASAARQPDEDADGAGGNRLGA